MFRNMCMAVLGAVHERLLDRYSLEATALYTPLLSLIYRWRRKENTNLDSFGYIE